MFLIDRHVGGDAPLFLIAGPCVIEGIDVCLRVANKLAEIRSRHKILVIFKSSFDKANRSSGDSFRGPGLDQGLKILQKVRDATGLPLITDVHLPEQCGPVAEVCDMIQIPALLSRQTDLLVAAAQTGRPLNVKKGQFMAPEDMKNVADKLGKDANFTICERGTTFGYHNLVVDMRGLEIMSGFAPVVFDATHSAQRPGSEGTHSGGDRHMAKALARAAVAMGVAGLFCETHPNPENAKSDGPNSIHLSEMSEFIGRLVQLDELVKQ